MDDSRPLLEKGTDIFAGHIPEVLELWDKYGALIPTNYGGVPEFRGFVTRIQTGKAALAAAEEAYNDARQAVKDTIRTPGFDTSMDYFTACGRTKELIVGNIAHGHGLACKDNGCHQAVLSAMRKAQGEDREVLERYQQAAWNARNAYIDFHVEQKLFAKHIRDGVSISNWLIDRRTDAADRERSEERWGRKRVSGPSYELPPEGEAIPPSIDGDGVELGGDAPPVGKYDYPIDVPRDDLIPAEPSPRARATTPKRPTGNPLSRILVASALAFATGGDPTAPDADRDRAGGGG